MKTEPAVVSQRESRDGSSEGVQPPQQRMVRAAEWDLPSAVRMPVTVLLVDGEADGWCIKEVSRPDSGPRMKRTPRTCLSKGWRADARPCWEASLISRCSLFMSCVP